MPGDIWIKIFDRWKDSVLRIRTIKGIYNPFRPYHRVSDEEHNGSAFVTDIRRGLVLTNAHVVRESLSITARSNKLGDQDLKLELIATCPDKDIAVCRLDQEAIDFLTKDMKNPEELNMKMGNNLKLRQGDPVCVLGFPLGTKGIKMTEGIVSGFESSLDDGDDDNGGDDFRVDSEEDPPFLEVSSSINPGNSGGPLLGAGGEVIGITAAGILMAQQIGYAIGIRSILSIYHRLVNPPEDRDLSKPYILITPKLAIDTCHSSPDLIKETCLSKMKDQESKTLGGLYVRNVYPNSCLPDLQPNDIITQITYLDPFWNNPSAFDATQNHSYDNIPGTQIVGTLDNFGDVTLVSACPEGKPKSSSSPFTCRKLALKEVLDLIPMGQPFQVLVCRPCDQASSTCEGVFWLQGVFDYVPSTIRLREIFRINPPDYEVFSGLSVSNLTLNHIMENKKLSEYAKDEERYIPYLVVNQIFPDTTADRTQAIHECDIVRWVDGEEISTLEELRGLLQKNHDLPNISLVTKKKAKFVVNRNQARKEDTQVLELFDIPEGHLHE